MNPPATAIGDPADLLDIDMHHMARDGIFCGVRLLPPAGLMNRRRFTPRTARIRVTVRTLITVPELFSSRQMRRADHFRDRRQCSISPITSTGVAVGWSAGCSSGHAARVRRAGDGG